MQDQRPVAGNQSWRLATGMQNWNLATGLQDWRLADEGLAGEPVESGKPKAAGTQPLEKGTQELVATAALA